MKYLYDMVDHINQKRIWRPWNQFGSICLHLRRYLKFAQERSVTSSGYEGTPAWTKAKPSSSRRSHWKTYRPAEARIFHRCIELAILIGKNSVHSNFSVLIHRMINFVVVTGSRWRRYAAVRFRTLSLPQKLARVFSRPGMGATAILATKKTWWHGNEDYGCSRFKL